MGISNDLKIMELDLLDEFWTYTCKAVSAGENLTFDDFVVFVENKAMEFSKERKEVLSTLDMTPQRLVDNFISRW